MMKAIAVYKPGEVKVVEVPKPKFGDYECLVRVRACGICNGTDLKIIHNAVADVDIKYPTIIGHEGVGEIVETGSKVRYLKIGDRIVCPSGTKEGYDDNSGFTYTWGGMSEYNITHDVQAMLDDDVVLPKSLNGISELDYLGKKIPEGMSYEDAVMILTFKENYSALLNFGIKKGDDVLLYGDGPVGCGIATFLKLIGAKNIVCVGLIDERLDIIKRLTGIPTINTTKESLDDMLGDSKFDYIVDAVGGSLELAKGAAKRLKPCGKICLYGVLKMENANLNMFEIPNNTCFHILNWPYHEHRTHDTIVKYIEEGKINPQNYYSHVMPMNEAAKAIKMIENREAYKIILTF